MLLFISSSELPFVVAKVEFVVIVLELHSKYLYLLDRQTLTRNYLFLYKAEFIGVLSTFPF